MIKIFGKPRSRLLGLDIDVDTKLRNINLDQDILMVEINFFETQSQDLLFDSVENESLDWDTIETNWGPPGFLDNSQHQLKFCQICLPIFTSSWPLRNFFLPPMVISPLGIGWPRLKPFAGGTTETPKNLRLGQVRLS
jgi:hypothetical protein